MNAPASKIRVAHLVTHPIQYFAPLYRSLASRPEIDLTVYFYSINSLELHIEPDFSRAVHWDTQLIGGYKYLICGNAQSLPHAQRMSWKPNLGIIRDLVAKRYDVIWIHGYVSGTAWAAAAVGKLRYTPVLLRDEQTHLTPRSALKRWAKQLILPRLFKNVSGLYIGTKNREFFKSYGTRNLYPASYAVDNEFFQRQSANLRNNRASIRARFGIGDQHPVILFSGKFVDKKKPNLLLKAFRKVRSAAKCHLLFVGDGPMRQQLQDIVCANGTPDVHFAGFLNQNEISSAYAASDLLVLPSAYLETWGLVVNEALNFRLPVIVSDHVGCAGDLVKDGQNGFVFPSGSVEALATAIQTLVESDELRSQFGQKGFEMVSAYSVEAVAAQLVQACLAAAKVQTTN